jgi:Fe-S cluster biogenesis protein NfuA/nitrite reductase/ring-hydroxylating ferredoxin subunit
VPDGDVGAQVEALLGELLEQGGHLAADTGEKMVRLLVEYYGAGLERICEIIGADRPDVVHQLAADPLVESQLILHGLHPLTVDERIEAALDRVRPYLGSHAGGVSFLGVDPDGVARLRLSGSCHGCASSTVTVSLTIEEAVRAAAPELTGIVVDGEVQSSPVLQIGRRAEASPAPAATHSVWRHPSAAELPHEGEVRSVQLGGSHVMAARIEDTYYAYVDRCPACEASLVSSTLHGSVLTCASCEGRYDVRLAGRAVDGSGRHLDPLPLLDDASGIRVALPEAV